MKYHDILTRIASKMPANNCPDRAEYPQLWYCWPLWTKRIKWIHAAKTWLCGKMTGHEWSKTEWGYGGSKHADCWCRWCGHHSYIPIAEAPPPNKTLADLSKKTSKNKKNE